jgi:hypothetical protein
MLVGGKGVPIDGVSRLSAVLIGWEGDIQLSVGVWGVWVGCWEGWFGVMGGLQQLVVHDGETERCGGGAGNGTNRGAVLRSARAKEVVQPGGILAGGGGEEGWW